MVLDLFCGGGGAAVGYWLAGFDVVGMVELNAHPEVIRARALLARFKAAGGEL